MGALGAFFQLHRVRVLIAAFAAVISVLLGGQFWQPQWVVRAELLLHDAHSGLHRQSGPVSQRITIVDIDEASIDALGAWPWPREVIAQLARTLFEHYHAHTVGLDIVFPEPADDTGDRQLAELTHRYPLVLAQAFDFSGRRDVVTVGKLGGQLDSVTTQSTPSIPRATGFIANHAAMVDGACVGHITPQPDFDGQVRRIAPFVRYAKKDYPMLSVAMLTCAPGSDAIPIAKLAPLALSMSRQSFMQIPDKYELQGYTVIPAIDIFSKTASRSLFDGQYVLVGSSAMGLSDRVSTPFHPWLPGVMVHAAVLGGLMDELNAPRVRYDLSWVSYAWTALSIILLAILFIRAHAKIVLAALVLLLTMWLIIADRLLISGHYVLITLPLIACAVFLFLQAPVEWSWEQTEKNRFVSRFRKYLPPVMVDHLVQQIKEADVLKAARRNITVLFVDMRGYTAVAEEIPPEQLAEFTQWMLGVLTEEVHKAGGTLDKYIGDALMAFWGAPLEQPDHADRAIDSAAGMLRAIARLNAQLPARFPAMQPVEICIGINSGEAVVGDIGTPIRSAYTAIGDVVNLASRLQDLAKTTEQKVLIGSATKNLARRHDLTLLEEFVIRGRRKGDSVYSFSTTTVTAATLPAQG